MSDERKRKRETGRPDLPEEEKSKLSKDPVEKAKTINRDTADFDLDVDTEPLDEQEKLIETPIMGADIDDLEDVEDYELNAGRDPDDRQKTPPPVPGGGKLDVGDFDPTEYELDIGRMVVEDEDEKEDEDE